MEERNKEQMNEDNIFAKYIDAINRKDHTEAARLGKEASVGVAVHKNRTVRHVSLKQMRAVRR